VDKLEKKGGEKILLKKIIVLERSKMPKTPDKVIPRGE